MLDYQYAAKFICGTPDAEESALAPGQYFTAINVHNPTARDVVLQRKIAVAGPRERAGLVSTFESVTLGADAAFEIDCRDILRQAGMEEGFLKGFVVIESDRELDVVAVYTATGGSGQVETLHLERVPPRRTNP